jgi:hypothetical protein
MWTLDVLYYKPGQITVSLPGHDGPQRFWFLIMTVTNNTPQAVDFYPNCVLVTDTFQVINAGSEINEMVFQQIKQRYKGTFPFLENIEFAVGKILSGADHARDIAVIWPDFDPKARSIDLLMSGLSNQTVAIDHPIEKTQNGEPKKIYLRKTLRLSYDLAGDPQFRSQTALEYVDTDWVMR